MAVNRLTLVCTACDEHLQPADGGVWPEPRPSVAIARLPIGGDWTGPRTEQYREAVMAANLDAWKFIDRRDPEYERTKAAEGFAADVREDKPLGERIAAFINRHRWHHDTGGGLDHLAFEWECNASCTSGGSGPED